MLIDGVGRKGYVLTVSNTLTDKDGLGEIHYQWLNDGDVIAGANQATYSLRQTDAGKHISVKASYIDEQNTQESMASQEMLIAENKAPTGKVIMKGTPLYGATLSVSNTIKDADGLGKLSYLWENDAGILSTSPRYTLIKNDIDTKLWVTAYYTDKQGNREEVKSAVVDVAVSTTSSVFNDRLEGNANANKLSGLGGNDTLIGGAGSDKLTGGSGADTFVFKKADFFSQNHTGALIFNQSVDTITDFHVKEHDILDFQEMGELHFYPSMSAAQDDHSAFLFYVKNVGKIYVNMSNTGDFTPINIIVLSGKPAINSDFIDWNVPTT
ncbi:MAG TPA: hypothetical protein DF614_01170 [Methylococcaceae bacterium]|nr:hypothetical protein [Methylococcaceae bacterium]